MIYLDSSVVLAELFMEDRRPPAALWDETLVSSRLVEYEVWTRFHARRLPPERGVGVRLVLSQITMYELDAKYLDRALQPFPIPLRTLDGLHLAMIDSLRTQGREIALASYDHRLLAAARALGLEIAAL